MVTAIANSFVVDNSVAMAWVYPKQATEYTERLLELSNGGTLYTSFVWPAEFANAASVMVNRGMLSDELGNEMLVMAANFAFMVDRAPIDASTLYQISRRFQLSAYDASYLELAIRLNMQLATRDVQLRKAADQVNLFFV